MVKYKICKYVANSANNIRGPFMDMNCIRITAEVIVYECIGIGKRIFLIIDEECMLQYVGHHDFNQVSSKVRMGEIILLGVDPSLTYCALVDDVIRHQLR